MSPHKITCPALSELITALDPSSSTRQDKTPKALCDNIFDVQRSELYEILEELRYVFWNDIPPQEINEEPAKRRISTVEDEPLKLSAKRRRSSGMSEKDTSKISAKRRSSGGEKEASKTSAKRHRPIIGPVVVLDKSKLSSSSLKSIKTTMIQHIRSARKCIE
ncbi:hypothetical protein BDB01DRAFT_854080 [Pilobolus umbonatus]|nr:hypothetical protein BDB01DRAFT_854080 [Pilobolus umbonatus]